MRSQIALAIVNSIEIPADIKEMLQDFRQYDRRSTMNGGYTVYFHDDIKIDVAKLLTWLNTTPTRLDDDNEIIDSYQLVIYTPENDHEVMQYGYIWFEINLGLIF